MLSPNEARHDAFLVALSEKQQGVARYQSAIEYAYLGQLYRSDPELSREAATKYLIAFRNEWRSLDPDYSQQSAINAYRTDSEQVGLVLDLLSKVKLKDMPVDAVGALKSLQQYLDKQFIAKWQAEEDAFQQQRTTESQFGAGLVQDWAQEQNSAAWAQCNLDPGQEQFCNSADALVGPASGVSLTATYPDLVAVSPAVRILDRLFNISTQIEELEDDNGELAGDIEGVQVSVARLREELTKEFEQLHADLTAVRADVRGVAETQRSILGILLTQEQRAEQQRFMEQQAAAYQLKLSAAKSSLFLLTSLLGTVDTASARQLAAVGEAMITIVDSTIKFGEAMSKVGDALAAGLTATIFTGNIAAAGIAMIGALLDTGPTPEQLILDEVRRVRRDIADLRQDVSQRLALIDAKLDNVLNTLIQGLSSIDIQLSDLRQDVNDLKARLRGDIDRITRRQTAASEVAYDTAVRPLLATIDSALEASPPTEMSLAEFRDYESTLYTWATRNALDRAATGPDTRSTLPADLAEELAGPYDANLNYLQAFLESRGRTPLETGRLPNAAQWKLAASAYARLLLSRPDYALQVDKSRLSSVVNVGSRLSTALARWSDNAGAAQAALDYHSERLDDLAFWLESIRRDFAGRVGVDPLGGSEEDLRGVGAREVNLGDLRGCNGARTLAPITPQKVDALLPTALRALRRMAAYYGTPIDDKFTACYEVRFADVTVQSPYTYRWELRANLVFTLRIFYDRQVVSVSTATSRRGLAVQAFEKDLPTAEAIFAKIWAGENIVDNFEFRTDAMFIHPSWDRAALEERGAYWANRAWVCEYPEGGECSPGGSVERDWTFYFNQLRRSFEQHLASRIVSASTSDPPKTLTGSKRMLQEMVQASLPVGAQGNETLHTLLYGDEAIWDERALLTALAGVGSQPIRHESSIYEWLLGEALRRRQVLYEELAWHGNAVSGIPPLYNEVYGDVAFASRLLEVASRVRERAREAPAGTLAGLALGEAVRSGPIVCRIGC